MDRLTLTVPEAAERLGVSPRTAYDWTATGRLPHVRVGHRVLVPVAALEQWVVDQTRGGEVGKTSSNSPPPLILLRTEPRPPRTHGKRKNLTQEGY